MGRAQGRTTQAATITPMRRGAISAETKVTKPGYKICTKCDKEKPLSQYSKKREGKLHSWCKGCVSENSKAHYQANKTNYMKRNTARKEAARDYVYNYLLTHPCVDCGEKDLVVLEFDHQGNKEYNIHRMIPSGATPQALQKEIDKCEVVCANCHRKRTARSQNWSRLTPDTIKLADPRQARNANYIISYLQEHPCVSCGETDLTCLDFDHRDPSEKVAGVGDMAARKMSLSNVVAEVAKCDVTCVNCHHRRTAEQQGWTKATFAFEAEAADEAVAA